MSYAAGFITAKNEVEGKKIAGNLLEKKLVACCNIIPKINSIYWWKGKIENTTESLLIIKTRKELTDKIIEEVRKTHSYETPGIEFLKIVKGNPDFLEWISKETKKGMV